MTSFLARLRNAADTLSVTERQRIVRLVVKEVLIGEDTRLLFGTVSPSRQVCPQNDGAPVDRTHKITSQQWACSAHWLVNIYLNEFPRLGL